MPDRACRVSSPWISSPFSSTPATRTIVTGYSRLGVAPWYIGGWLSKLITSCHLIWQAWQEGEGFDSAPCLSRDWPTEIDWRIRRYSLGTATLELPLERRVSSASHRVLRKILFRFPSRGSPIRHLSTIFFPQMFLLLVGWKKNIHEKIYPLFYIVLKLNLYLFSLFLNIHLTFLWLMHDSNNLNQMWIQNFMHNFSRSW